jgi:hypothetical protein
MIEAIKKVIDSIFIMFHQIICKVYKIYQQNKSCLYNHLEKDNRMTYINMLNLVYYI